MGLVSTRYAAAAHQIRPGLSLICGSAGMDDRYWLSARKLPDAEGQAWEARAATAIIGNIADSGAKLATKPTRRQPGLICRSRPYSGSMRRGAEDLT